MLATVIRRLKHSLGNIAIAAALVALAGVALWAFVLRGSADERQLLASQPPSSEAEPTLTRVPEPTGGPSPTSVPEPTAIALQISALICTCFAVCIRRRLG